jgi:hypothetical protein
MQLVQEVSRHLHRYGDGVEMVVRLSLGTVRYRRNDGRERTACNS